MKFAFFDTEYGDSNGTALLQLAIVTSDGYEYNGFYSVDVPINSHTMKVHHITPEMVADKPHFSKSIIEEGQKVHEGYVGKSISEYIRFLITEYTFVAHNIDADVGVISANGVDIPDALCTYRTARKYLLTPEGKEYESYALQYLRYELGLYRLESEEDRTAHDALSDVRFLINLFNYIDKTCDCDYEEMLACSKEPPVMRKFTFGKYRGEMIEDVVRNDPGYVQWFLNTIHDRPELTHNIKKALGKI